MARNKLHITSENSAEWLASCGFIFPTNEIELARFNKLYGDLDPSITGKEVDPFKIIKGAVIEKQNYFHAALHIPMSQYQMVARNMNDLPSHILDKIKSNQETKPDNDNSAEEKNNK